MFGNLFKSNQPKYTIENTVWKTTIVKEAAILKFILENDNIILFYFNQDTKQLFANLFDTRNIQYSEYLSDNSPLIMYDANKALQNLTSLSNKQILFIEHNNSFRKEKEVLDFIVEKIESKIFHFYVSLDDVLFDNFNSDSLKSLLDKLGFNDSDSISHSMIDSSIQKLQEKFDSKN